jgi:hypothetical protein
MNRKIIESYKAKGIEIVKEPDFTSVYSEVMRNLGNTNSEMRESCLDILWELVQSGELSNSVLIDTGNELLENLGHGLGERGADSVFLRTFSALIVGVIVSQDEIRRIKREKGRESFLSYERFGGWYEASKKYVLDEKDYRGYIPGKGWAHSISHGGDLLRDFAFHSFTSRAEHLDILNILSTQLTTNTEEIYVNNDDNRLARIVVTIMLREELVLADYENWLNDLLARFEGQYWPDFSSEENRGKVVVWFNTTTFLRALYFVLLNGIKNLKGIDFYEKTPGLNEEVKGLVLKTLKRMDNGLNYR